MPEAPPARAGNRLKLRFSQRWPGFLGWMADCINRVHWTLRRIFSRDILIFDLSSSAPADGHDSREPRAPARPENPALAKNTGEILVFRLSASDFHLQHAASGHNGSRNGNGKGKANGEADRAAGALAG